VVDQLIGTAPKRVLSDRLTVLAGQTA